MNKDFAELEIGLRWRPQIAGFDVTLHYSNPSKEDDNRELGEQPLRIDCERLRTLVADEDAYAKVLSESLFGLEEVDSFFKESAAVTERTATELGGPVPLHLRLLIDPRAPARFHSLRWETLRDPRDGTPIAKKQDVLFSRYLTSADWRPISTRPKHELSALIAVANPVGLDQFAPDGMPLKPVDVDEELQRAKAALGESQVTLVASRGEATLNNIINKLEQGRHDILYLICHGALLRGQPRLYLEQPDGGVAQTDGVELVERLRDMRQRPTLIVLSACQSAGADELGSSRDGGALAALGPRLARAGTAAVIAMQDNVTVRTVAMFMPPLFEELKGQGIIDLAMARARQAIRDRPDWWAPVLFTRLRTGRIWFVPEFRQGAALWNTVLQRIDVRKCTPILGPALSDGLVGSRQHIASRWADHWQIPMAPHNREDLAKVTQYLTVYQDIQFPRLELTRYVRRLFRKEYADRLPASVLDGPSLDRIIAEAGRLQRQENPAVLDGGGDRLPDPYAVMAELPFPLYITTSWTSLLEEALTDADRKPNIDSFAWNEQVDSEPGGLPTGPEATDANPFVYRLFGQVDDPDSLVLTEDDHYAWLESWTANRTVSVPNEVTGALVSTTLLFLGFRLDDSDFRVLFHGIKALKGSDRLKRYSHVGVQLNPESQLIEPEAAQEYLESYFGPDKVSIYWGSTRQFLAELHQRWNRAKEG